jgi:hypothetical protein
MSSVVHAASALKVPILNDDRYLPLDKRGDFENLLKSMNAKDSDPNKKLNLFQAPMQLHAKFLQFIHPISKKEISIGAPLPEESQRVYKAFGFIPEDIEKSLKYSSFTERINDSTVAPLKSNPLRQVTAPKERRGENPSRRDLIRSKSLIGKEKLKANPNRRNSRSKTKKGTQRK